MSSHKILRIASPDISLRQKLSRQLRISEILAQILLNRGLNEAAAAEKFLNAGLAHLHDPNTFSGMPKAVGLIKEAAGKKEAVMVFGDYDADGITALALLKRALESMGLEVAHYLPHRINEGYGLNKNVLDFARQRKVKLLLTVDCGIANHAEIRELKRQGIETIITDHHEPPVEGLPPAASIINPKVEGETYPYRDLAGVGVAYKLAQAFTGSCLTDELDLVCLGTVADSAPLTGENRVIAREGLLKLARTKKAGLRALIENAGIQNKKFTSTFVSFILAPRINASGRMDSAEASLKLLLSQDGEEAGELAKVLEAHNRQRQKVEGRILQEAEDMINKEVNFKQQKIIVVAGDNWHQGVLGIVASKIADRFYRPTVVISLSGGLCRGSARSIRNFHLFQALVDCRGFLSSFGGHAHAAGLVIAEENIAGFRESINRLAGERLLLEDLLPGLDVDLEVGLAELSEEVIRELEALEPFGAGNPEPLFFTRGLKLKSQPQVLARETLKFWLTDGAVTYQAIGFGLSPLKESLEQADYFDLVYTPRMDEWRSEAEVILEAREIFFH